MALPLHGYELFQSRDLDHVRDEMARVLCPHDVKLLDRDGSLNAQMNSLPLDNVVLNYVHYGTSVFVNPGRTEDFIAVQAPLSGTGSIQCGLDTIESTRDKILVSRQNEPLSMRLSPDACLVLVKMSWPFLVATLSDMLGGYIPWPLRFELSMNVKTGRQQNWYQFLINYLRRASTTDLVGRRLWEPYFQERLAIGLLRAQPNSYSTILNARPLPAPPLTLQRAIDILESTPEVAHTEGSIANEVDISTRALHEAFRSKLASSVPDYLFHVRLRRAYQTLRWAEPGEVTITGVARRWGFVEPEFSRWYFREFGETPLQTLFR
jgi:AraC-like DNA-binding protein